MSVSTNVVWWTFKVNINEISNAYKKLIVRVVNFNEFWNTRVSYIKRSDLYTEIFLLRIFKKNRPFTRNIFRFFSNLFRKYLNIFYSSAARITFASVNYEYLHFVRLFFKNSYIPSTFKHWTRKKKFATDDN